MEESSFTGDNETFSPEQKFHYEKLTSERSGEREINLCSSASSFSEHFLFNHLLGTHPLKFKHEGKELFHNPENIKSTLKIW